MQPPDHLERQRALAIEHFVHAIATADKGNEIAWLKAALFHVIPDRLDRIRKIEWEALALPGLHQRDEHVQAITLGRVAPGPHESLDLLEDTAVISLGLDGYDLHVA